MPEKAARTLIPESIPHMWKFYHVSDSTYSTAHPVAYEYRNGILCVVAETTISPSTGNQYKIIATWAPSYNEWIVLDRVKIN